jgi:hypothetical protein
MRCPRGLGSIDVAPTLPQGQLRVALCREGVMTACEVAGLLSMPVSTVHYLALRGRLPA